MTSYGLGIAVTAGNYQVGRDADGTNQLHFNVPSGASFEWSINDVAVLGLTSNVLNTLRPLDFGAGIAITAADYQVARDADGTNQLHLNVPTGATMEWSVNDVAILVLSSTILTLSDAVNIAVNATTGTKIGTATTQKLGFFNATPIVQVSAISAPSGGATIDAEARTAINSIRTALTNLGLTA